MQKFTKLNGKTAYLPLNDIDTDRIIPKQFLKTIKREGLGKFLFSDMRYDSNGNNINDFILNQRVGASILLSGHNFGCGSSREHAPWALLDFGIRVIIAPSFADIFYNNCFKNGLLPIAIPEEIISTIAKNDTILVDLENQNLLYSNTTTPFAIDKHRKHMLINGIDEIEELLQFKDELENFENQYFKKYPWI